MRKQQVIYWRKILHVIHGSDDEHPTGLRVLSDPGLVTSETAPPFDKCICPSRVAALEGWLPPADSQWKGGWEDIGSYPAVTFAASRIADRRPVLRSFRGGPEPAPEAGRFSLRGPSQWRTGQKVRSHSLPAGRISMSVCALV